MKSASGVALGVVLLFRRARESVPLAQIAREETWDIRWDAPPLAIQLAEAVDPPPTVALASRAVAQAAEQLGGDPSTQVVVSEAMSVTAPPWVVQAIRRRARALLAELGGKVSEPIDLAEIEKLRICIARLSTHWAITAIRLYLNVDDQRPYA